MIKKLIRRQRKKKNKVVKRGLPPGSIVYVGENPSIPPQLKLIQYNEKNVSEKSASWDEVKAAQPDLVNWLNLDGLADTQLISQLGEHFGIHALILEDIVNADKRVSLDEYDDCIVLRVKMINLSQDQSFLESEPITVILKSNWVFTFQEKPGDLFNPIRERLQSPKSIARAKKADYLFYALLDIIIDQYFLILEKMEEDLHDLEEQTIEVEKDYLNYINELKSRFIYVKKNLRNINEVIYNLNKLDHFFENKTKKYLKDTMDHAHQINDQLDNFFDRLNHQIDSFHTETNLRLSQSMNLLTIIGTIFIPLTFITSIYGMNFKWMPELEWKFSYPVLWSVLTISGLLMYIILTRRNK